VKKPVLIREETIRNTSDGTIKRSFDYSKQTTDTYEWNVTAGLKLTAGAKASVGLPLVGEGEISTSVELSLEAGARSEHTDTVTDVRFTANAVAFGQVGCSRSRALQRDRGLPRVDHRRTGGAEDGRGRRGRRELIARCRWCRAGTWAGAVGWSPSQAQGARPTTLATERPGREITRTRRRERVLGCDAALRARLVRARRRSWRRLPERPS
jgi:hypothetical protein